MAVRLEIGNSAKRASSSRVGGSSGAPVAGLPASRKKRPSRLVVMISLRALPRRRCARRDERFAARE